MIHNYTQNIVSSAPKYNAVSSRHYIKISFTYIRSIDKALFLETVGSTLQVGLLSNIFASENLVDKCLNDICSTTYQRSAKANIWKRYTCLGEWTLRRLIIGIA